jgi:hypothetical protein
LRLPAPRVGMTRRRRTAGFALGARCAAESSARAHEVLRLSSLAPRRYQMDGATPRSGRIPLLTRSTGCHRTSLARAGTSSALASEQVRDFARCVPAAGTLDRCRVVLLPRLPCTRLALAALTRRDVRARPAHFPRLLPGLWAAAERRSRHGHAPAAHGAMQRAHHSGIVLRIVGSAVRIDQSVSPSSPLSDSRLTYKQRALRKGKD